jgi:hypothetical protein
MREREELAREAREKEERDAADAAARAAARQSSSSPPSSTSHLPPHALQTPSSSSTLSRHGRTGLLPSSANTIAEEGAEGEGDEENEATPRFANLNLNHRATSSSSRSHRPSPPPELPSLSQLHQTRSQNSENDPHRQKSRHRYSPSMPSPQGNSSAYSRGGEGRDSPASSRLRENKENVGEVDGSGREDPPTGGRGEDGGSHHRAISQPYKPPNSPRSTLPPPLPLAHSQQHHQLQQQQHPSFPPTHSHPQQPAYDPRYLPPDPIYPPSHLSSDHHSQPQHHHLHHSQQQPQSHYGMQTPSSNGYYDTVTRLFLP